MAIKTWIIALTSAAIIIMFQNCAKNPNLNQQASNGTATSASTATTTQPTPPSGQAPQILSSAQNITVAAGQPVDVAITATGPNLQYQWLLNSQPINNATNTLSIASAAAANAGTYTLNVSNAYGTAPISFTLNVTTPNPVIAPPVITTAPASVTAIYDATINTFNVSNDTTPPYDLVVFNVTASGTNLTYQWYKVSSTGTVTAIPNATQATYSFTLNAFGLGGTYRVVVTNAGGSVYADAGLSVHVVPIIDPYPPNKPIP